LIGGKSNAERVAGHSRDGWPARWAAIVNGGWRQIEVLDHPRTVAPPSALAEYAGNGKKD
jgi:hypothetical protein